MNMYSYSLYLIIKSILYQIVLIKNESQDSVLRGQIHSRIDSPNYLMGFQDLQLE